MSRIPMWLSILNPERELKADIDQSRWHDPASYPDWWIERSASLFEMLRRSSNAVGVSSYSEYGCGPNRPFGAVVDRQDPNIKRHSLDLRRWADDVIECNLDNLTIENLPPQSDCGVLSGVVEYLQDAARTFALLANAHRYLLISYCCADFEKAKSPKNQIALIAGRVKMGWRNHMTLVEFIAATHSFGYICKIELWRHQVLVLVAKN